MKILHISLFVVLAGFMSWDVQQDTLLSFLARHPRQDSIRVNAFILKGDRYYDSGNRDSAIIWYKKAIDLSMEIKYYNGAAKGYQYAGILLSDQGAYVETIDYYNKAIEFYKKAGNKKGVAGCTVNIGNVFYFQGLFKESLSYFLQAQQQIEELKDSARMPVLYTNMGSVYYEINEYEKSAAFHNRSLRLAQRRNDSLQMTRAFINLGVTLLHSDLPGSEMNFRKGLAIARLRSDGRNQYEALNNLASIEKIKRNYAEARQLSLQAVDLAKETDDPYLITSALTTLGSHYIDAGENQRALMVLKECLTIGTKHKLRDNLALAYFYLSLAEENLQQYSQALNDFKTSSAFFDSIANEQTDKAIGRIEGKYDLEGQLREQKASEEKRLRIIQLQNAKRDRIQYFSIVFVIIILFIGIKLIGNLKISANVSHLVTLISVLILFEFLLIMIDPYVDNLSGSVPAYKLLINLVVALLIFPVNEWLLRILSQTKGSESPGTT